MIDFATKGSSLSSDRQGSSVVDKQSTNQLQNEPTFFITRFSPWSTTMARILLGMVLAWFGYHELILPGLWTGYVPFLSASSHFAQVLVLTHGIVLSILAVALIAGILPRSAAVVASLVMLEIIVSLVITAGLSDLVMRDIGVLGLALAVISTSHERLVLSH